jgi:hypothetical protein
MSEQGLSPSPLIEWHHYKRSRLNYLGVGRWFCSTSDNGPALREGPHRINGLFLNTRWGLYGVTVRRRSE